MNKAIDFDNKFQELLAEMVGIGFDFVNSNSIEVDAVYVIGIIESGFFYKVFYKINDQVTKSHKVNSVSKVQYDTSNDSAFEMLRRGNDILKEIESLFKSDNREVPKMLKLIYHPKTGKFDSDFSYEKNFTNHSSKTAQDVYEEWFNEVENKA